MVEHSPGNFHMQMVSRGRSKCHWFDLKIDHLSDRDIQSISAMSYILGYDEVAEQDFSVW